MNEQLLKTSGADVLSSRRKLRKTLAGPAGWHPLKGFQSDKTEYREILLKYSLLITYLGITI